MKDRRSKLDPVALGFTSKRRRTPGLRREEVAQRANISTAWYTWLEQGRGGAPSAEVLERIAEALMLTQVEREHVFMLGLGRPPEVRYEQRDAITPRLQRVLDRLNPSPALIRTAIWDVVAWNQAATALMADYGSLAPENRNVLKHIFLNPRVRASQRDWESVARYVVGSFRADVVRAGATSAVGDLVDELCRRSADFARMWRDTHVHASQERVKHIHHPVLGPFSFEHSAFAVDGRPDLTMIVYNPVTEADLDKVVNALASA
ncbi:helix-turn-helix transcriptional regulator [Dyella sp.]|uniref:helix-turn-helix transcriptional regulator n=1 Tax=Dyella sp. TaxID=1869338 RepID=UPI002B49EAEC|nr:helix-turn-helix transcriptional regulator [Dyella sp.]HKT30568.1 helix-turn-helix transcriptional regulator [Dyella sp.]